MHQSILNLPISLWSHISLHRRRQFCFLLLLTIISALAEVVSLGAVLPFIGILTNPEMVFKNPWLAEPINFFGIKSGAELVYPIAIGFAVAALLAGGLRLLLLRVSVGLANSIGADLSIEVYRRTLYQPYGVHIRRSSSEIISGITQKVSTATSVLISIVAFITSTTLFVAIMFALVAVNPVIAFIAAMSFSTAYGLVAWLTRRRLAKNSQSIALEQTQVVKALQEGLGGIRDVLLDGVQEIYCRVYSKAILGLQRASGENTFISQAPRYAMEALGMSLIAVFVLGLSGSPDGIVAALPMLAMLALGAQRLLPLMQQLYGNWSVIAGNQATLNDVLVLLEQPLPAHASASDIKPMAFNKCIQFDNVTFKYYKDEAWALEAINLKIPKGSRVGIIGATGSGKSTAMDLLMGLLERSGGYITVDGVPIDASNIAAWQKIIAHVPQDIFLTDGSVAENIAFGVERDQINFERVQKAAQQAMLSQFIEGQKMGYNSTVGERGVRLSGGQRQRIAIARALYKNASVLIFDEATSALDGDTEEAVMQAIEGLSKDLTLIVIAHRLTSLKGCDFIVKLEGGRVQMQGSYSQVIGGG